MPQRQAHPAKTSQKFEARKLAAWQAGKGMLKG
jgi:hypothetical protein